ncbi:general amino acid permease [Scheffersomyces coipomensis]|uniref:general amino acid permease n=1 Tax=Scheffersomyces coipomensis TaxID=1788519 RepID=UPI00315DE6A1
MSLVKNISEKTTASEDNSSAYSSSDASIKQSKWKNFKDSFKPAESNQVENLEDRTDLEMANAETSKGDLHRELKGKHIQMIAIGGSIGTGLFIGSGTALRTGGPASLLIAWGLVGTMVFCVIHALGELCVAYPVNGAFSTYATRFVCRSWGFAVGWNYAMMWLVVFPLELVAAAMCIKYWDSTINPVAWVGIFYVGLLAINIFGVKGYGETEFVLTIIKIIAIVGFIILGIVLICGGGPTHDFIGNRYFKSPGAFANGFEGVATVFITASYSLAGSEMVGLASAEVKNPAKELPKAVRQVFWRLFLFYFLSLMVIGLLVPYDSPDLLGASSDSSTSPFVIAIKKGGIKILPSIFNAAILISILSVGNAAVYGCSRTIQSLGAQGLAPKWVGYVDRKGRPLGGLAISAVFGLLCFLSAYEDQGLVFGWLLSVCGLATIFSWFNISLCHVRFRMALKAQGRSTDELVFTSIGGVYASIYSMLFLVVVLVLVFIYSLFPPGSNGKANATNFFQNYLGVIFVIIFYVGHKLITRNWKFYIKLKDIDLNTGKRDTNLNEEVTEEVDTSTQSKTILSYFSS